MNKESIFALANCIASIAQARPDLEPRTIASTILAADKIARQLHKRYENACNYAWATTDEYEVRTDKLEAKLMKLAEPMVSRIFGRSNIDFELQRDPRGWPLTVHFERQSHRIGG